MILLHILHSKHRVTLPSLIKRLHDLQSQTVAEPIVARNTAIARAHPSPSNPRSACCHAPCSRTCLCGERTQEKQAEPPELTISSPIPQADAATPPIPEPVFEKTVEERKV